VLMTRCGRFTKSAAHTCLDGALILEMAFEPVSTRRRRSTKRSLTQRPKSFLETRIALTTQADLEG
jgi:hypothetical protein